MIITPQQLSAAMDQANILDLDLPKGEFDGEAEIICSIGMPVTRHSIYAVLEHQYNFGYPVEFDDNHNIVVSEYPTSHHPIIKFDDEAITRILDIIYPNGDGVKYSNQETTSTKKAIENAFGIN